MTAPPTSGRAFGSIAAIWNPLEPRSDGNSRLRLETEGSRHSRMERAVSIRSARLQLDKPVSIQLCNGFRSHVVLTPRKGAPICFAPCRDRTQGGRTPNPSGNPTDHMAGPFWALLHTSYFMDDVTPPDPSGHSHFTCPELWITRMQSRLAPLVTI